MDLLPPRAPKPDYTAVHKTRWEKEKIAAGSEHAFDSPNDPNFLGNWHMGEMVGRGASGRVKIAKHKITGELAAVKILPKGEIEKQKVSVEREIVMMKLMEHPNVLKLYDIWEGENDLYLIFEYVKGGELFDYIVNHGRLEPAEALGWFKQIISGLAYTHALGVSHRDLKPENLLIASLNPPHLKIADWGMAAFTPPSFELYTSCGSPHYASPQIVNGEPYEGAASDIWSCGVILYALLTGRLPFDDKNIKILLARVKSGKFEMPSFVVEEGQDLIRRMLVVDVNERISMSEILSHPFMSMETPSITFHPPPSLEDLARPIPDDIVYSGEVDDDTMCSLRVIWRGNADDDTLKQELLSPGATLAKAFYWLLDRYRERRLERYGMDDEYEDGFLERLIGGDGGPKPYQLVIPTPKSSEPLSPTLLPSTPAQLSSMSSTLAAFEMVGKEDLQEEVYPSRKIKVRTSYAKPKGPRQVAPPSSNATGIFAKGLGLLSPKIPATNAPAVNETAPSDELDKFHNVLGDFNKHTPATTDPFTTGPTSEKQTGRADPVKAKARSVAFNVAEKENLERLLDGTREIKDPASPSPSPRVMRPRAGTIAAPTEYEIKGMRASPRRVPSLAEKRIKTRRASHVLPALHPNSNLISPYPAAAPLDLANSPPLPKVSLALACPHRAAPPPPPRATPAPPTAPSSPFIGSPVTEFFANLFHWRPQTYVLRSFHGLAATSRECEKLLIKNRVVVDKESNDVWKCWVQPHHDSYGQLLIKEVKFRIELSSVEDFDTPLASPSPVSTPRARPVSVKPHRDATTSGSGGFLTTITLVQEKGALSTLKATYSRIKDEWRLDSMNTSLLVGT